MPMMKKHFHSRTTCSIFNNFELLREQNFYTYYF
uniref:Uncharacterized protein n=1 Tax=Anguilla anguilla TaxID=7936 RepID=A0A0E9RGI6_ANGAN